MNRVARVLALALFLVGQAAWAADDRPEQVPQGPAPAPGPSTAHPEIIAYKPIPTSMLPGQEEPAGQMPITQPSVLPMPTNLGGPPTTMTLGPYTLGRDDVVYIQVAGQPDFTGSYVVGPNGSIQYGFVGDVPADGLTKDELQQVLTELLKKYIRTPSVYVTIVGFNSKAIYILGEVARPGKYAMRGDSLKIRDALIAAGLVTAQAALSKVYVIKADPNDPTYRIVNVKRVLFKGIMKDNIDLVHGDIVVVPATLWGRISSFITSLTNPASKARSLAYLAAI
jgi:polysaccharide export outer membrane protein